jgi:hypothetical protein
MSDAIVDGQDVGQIDFNIKQVDLVHAFNLVPSSELCITHKFAICGTASFPFIPTGLRPPAQGWPSSTAAGLPWVLGPLRNNPNGVAPKSPMIGATPSALKSKRLIIPSVQIGRPPVKRWCD